ncbi:alpha/beta fold hydrolase, partial [Mycobacterium asiaticum]|uniref:alpha/beta fold hydrolase n=1 Tax=Mycobacterium asiaticum TaxID=1790 RepID=UPI003F511DDF
MARLDRHHHGVRNLLRQPLLPGHTERAIAEVVRFDSTSWVGDIDVPTAVVVTMKDRAFGVARQKWLAEQIPDAVMVPIEA